MCERGLAVPILSANGGERFADKRDFCEQRMLLKCKLLYKTVGCDVAAGMKNITFIIRIYESA